MILTCLLLERRLETDEETIRCFAVNVRSGMADFGWGMSGKGTAGIRQAQHYPGDGG
jgi:hypothetical protein